MDADPFSSNAESPESPAIGTRLPDGAALLLDLTFNRTSLPDGWEVETGVWTPTAEGLIGSIDHDSAAVIWCGERFPGDVMLVLEAEAMPGHDNDANAFFRAAGSVYGRGGVEAEDEAARDTTAWILGTAGWYVHDHGLEKHPHGPTWRVSGDPLVPGTVVHVAAAYRHRRLSLWKDGRLLIEREDPDPPGDATASTPHDRIGLGTWNSSIRFRRLQVYGFASGGDA